MQDAIERLRTDIEEFFDQLQRKRKAYQEAMRRDEVLAITKKIYIEIKELESTIVAVVEQHLKIREKQSS